MGEKRKRKGRHFKSAICIDTTHRLRTCIYCIAAGESNTHLFYLLIVLSVKKKVRSMLSKTTSCVTCAACFALQLVYTDMEEHFIGYIQNPHDQAFLTISVSAHEAYPELRKCFLKTWKRFPRGSLVPETSRKLSNCFKRL